MNGKTQEVFVVNFDEFVIFFCFVHQKILQGANHEQVQFPFSAKQQILFLIKVVVFGIQNHRAVIISQVWNSLWSYCLVTVNMWTFSLKNNVLIYTLVWRRDKLGVFLSDE